MSAWFFIEKNNLIMILTGTKKEIRLHLKDNGCTEVLYSGNNKCFFATKKGHEYWIPKMTNGNFSIPNAFYKK